MPPSDQIKWLVAIFVAIWQSREKWQSINGSDMSSALGLVSCARSTEGFYRDQWFADSPNMWPISEHFIQALGN